MLHHLACRNRQSVTDVSVFCVYQMLTYATVDSSSGTLAWSNERDTHFVMRILTSQMSGHPTSDESCTTCDKNAVNIVTRFESCDASKDPGNFVRLIDSWCSVGLPNHLNKQMKMFEELANFKSSFESCAKLPRVFLTVQHFIRL